MRSGQISAPSKSWGPTQGGNSLPVFQPSGIQILEESTDEICLGWTDPLNAATWPIQQLDRMQKAMGGDVSSFFGPLMVPGGGHCGSNSQFPASPGTYHVTDALIAWVEKGMKPQSVLATGTSGYTAISRLLCPWPEHAVYTKS